MPSLNFNADFINRFKKLSVHQDSHKQIKWFYALFKNKILYMNISVNIVSLYVGKLSHSFIPT